MADKVQCQFFVLKKKRLCRMTVRIGEKYCGEHIDHDVKGNSDKQSNDAVIENNTAGSERLRVPCPFDSNHSCYKSHLQKHIARCNSRPSDTKPAYISPSINAGPLEEEVPKVHLNDVTDDELLSIINKIKNIYKECTEIEEQIHEHPALAEEILRPDIGAPALKHLKQNSSLIGILESKNLIKGDSCFVELGAGKGKLTFWLAHAAQKRENCRFALVDVSTYRHKSENKLAVEGVKSEVIRVLADVADLCLDKVEYHEGCKFVVPISKHLCGAATDLALRCVGNAVSSDFPAQIEGLVMALCCHHRCEWRHYVGKEFLKGVGVTPGDFPLMCVLVSWATCGTGKSRQAEEKQPNPQVQEENPHRDRYDRLNLTREIREEIGRKCKHVIDQGRVEFLKSIGFKSELVYYVKQNVTLENVCLVASK